MTDLPTPSGESVTPPSRARAALLKRLADVVCLPSSRVNAFERSVVADLLIDMLREAAVEERVRVARRLASLGDLPGSLARLLLRDTLEVARPLLELSAGLSDAELLDCARRGGAEHRALLAARRGVGELVAEALVERALDGGERGVVETLLRNELARLSGGALDLLVARSRGEPGLIPLLLKRAELRPSHAYVLFWWAGAADRRTVLQRFAVTREVMQDAVGDVFPMMAVEGWQDPMARKALQFIERRQRNRAAIDKSPYDSLDAAVAVAAGGLTRELAEEISYLSGVKPMTGAKIFTDAGGEPLAILCKATGLPRAAIKALWRGLRRAETDAEGRPNPQLEAVLTLYDSLAVDRAQTVLRYWNWSLTSALTPELMQAIRSGDGAALDEFSAPQRAAALLLGR